MLPKVTRVERNVEFRLTITQNYVNLLFTASKLVITKTKVSKSEFLRLIMDIEPFSKKKHKIRRTQERLKARSLVLKYYY